MSLNLDIGDIRIDRIIELETHFDPFEFLPELTKDQLDSNRDWMIDCGALHPETGQLIFVMQSYLVRTPHHTILLDSCVGNDKRHPNRPSWHMRSDDTYLRALAAAGVSVDDIDFVMCTHLHPDHVGWNTKLENGRWVPTFPKAKYVFSDKELAHWTAQNAENEIPYMTDSVLPVVEAGLVQQVSSDYAFDDHIRLQPTPGHTPDHYAVHMHSGDHHAVMCGDLIHSPIQCKYPETAARPDFDKALAKQTRRAFLEATCESGATMCTAHFPNPSIGKVKQAGEAFRFEFGM